MGEYVSMSRTFGLVAFALACGLIPALILPPAANRSEAHIASAADVITGTARIIDGDTLDINGERIRLHGIDAPEAGQTCPGGATGTWDCGDAATKHLRKLADGAITCEGHERDAYSRLIGTCFSGGRNINSEMVRQGYAWAFVKYAQDYVVDQQQSQTAKAGIWAASEPAEAPWIYRKQRWSNANVAAPDGCAIKGNISRSGRIYHVPWSPWYDKVSISLPRGERWFCTEQEAIAAGWRPARS